MPENVLDQIVNEYLDRLKIALSDLPPERRRQLIASITDHINEARSTLDANSEVAIRDILDRVGRPEDIAADAMSDETVSTVRRSTRSKQSGVIAVAAAVAVVIAIGAFVVSRIINASPTIATSATVTTTIMRITVPNVVGLKMDAAEAELMSSRFGVVWIYVCPQLRTLPNVVVSQSPRPGSSAAAGSQVQIKGSRKNCP